MQQCFGSMIENKIFLIKNFMWKHQEILLKLFSSQFNDFMDAFALVSFLNPENVNVLKKVMHQSFMRTR